MTSAPLSLFSSKAGASLYQPSQLGLDAEARTSYDQCPDDDIRGIGALCDGVSGKTVGVMPDGVISALNSQVNGSRDIVAETVQYMRDNGFVDADGKPLGDTNSNGPDGDDEGQDAKDEEKEKYEYIKFKNYCTEDRIDPVGMTTKPLEEEGSLDTDVEWWIYARCIGNDYNGKPRNEPKLTQNLFYFSRYYNLCETQMMMASDVPNCWQEVATPTQPSSGGSWVAPTAAGQCGGYGPRSNPLGGGSEFHKGLDIAVPAGTPIVAPADMRILFAGMGSNANGNNGYGNVVTATTSDSSNKDFRFGHMRDTPSVSAGQTVKKGQQIGVVGSTGMSTGAHLHFEVYPTGGVTIYTGHEDPRIALQQHGVTNQCR